MSTDKNKIPGRKSEPADLHGVETIVDTDSHVSESFEDLIPYIDDKYEASRRQIKNCQPEEKRRSRITTESQAGPKPGSSFNQYNIEERTASKDVKLSEIEDFGINKAVVSPGRMNRINTINNPRYAVALANAYNSWILDEVLDDNDSLSGVIVIPPQRPDIAAEEIDDRASEDQFCSVSMPLAGMLPPVGAKKYDPIYEAAERHDLPLVMHGTNTGMMWSFPTIFRNIQNKIESHSISHNLQNMWNLNTAILRGLPERFPDLDLVWLEAGISWIPHIKWRLDDNYLEKSSDVPWLEKLPSKYIDDNCYFCTQPMGHVENHEYYANILEMAGPNNIMYSADLPHHTFDPPENLYERIRPHFDDETVSNIMGDTAVDVFGL